MQLPEEEEMQRLQEWLLPPVGPEAMEIDVACTLLRLRPSERGPSAHGPCPGLGSSPGASSWAWEWALLRRSVSSILYLLRGSRRPGHLNLGPWR